MFEVKTRFRFSSEGGVGEKTRFGGGRFVIGTPSLPLHKPFLSLPLHKPFSSLTPHMPFSIISIPHTNIISPTSSSSTQKKIGLMATNPI